MTWMPKSLDEILDPSGRDRAGNQDLPVLSITMKHGLIDQAEKFKKRVASADTSNYRIAYKNELVVGFPIDEGVLGFQTKYPAGIVSPAYDIWKLKNEADCHIPYLERYLRSTQARSLYASRMQGAVARRRSLTKADFLRLEIPFPPLADQVRIVHVLCNVEGLIAQRKQHLQQLDDLLKGMFLEMFGFRDGTYTRWSAERLAANCDVVSGVTKGKKYAAEELIEVPYMRVANVQDGHFQLEDVKTIAVTRREIDQYRLQRGDLLLTEGGDPDKLGRGSVWEDQVQNCIHQNHIFRVRIDRREKLNPYYLSALVGSRYGKSYFLKSAKQTTGIASINSTQLKNFPTVVPPIDLQNHFASMVERIERIKLHYQQSLTDLESLYGAVSQRAFKGELDLSRVPFHGIPIEVEGTLTSAPLQAQPTAPPINLPDTRLLQEALENREHLKSLLQLWLNAYRSELGGAALSVEAFMTAARLRLTDQFQALVSDRSADEATKNRLVEAHPNNEFDLGANEYEYIKAWVFDALDAGKLAQAYDDEHNRIQLIAAQA
jgi:type I restriction enzyme, S subunit